MTPHENTSCPAATGVCVVNTVAAATCFECRGEWQPFGLLLVAPLDDLERCVALVQMPHGRLDIQCVQRTYAADSEHDLLHDPRRLVAAVKPVRDRAMRVAIFREVAVEKVQRRVAGLTSPDPQSNAVVSDRHRHSDFAPIGVGCDLQRQIFQLRRLVQLDLPAARVDVLLEEPLVVQQSDADERYRKIGRRLAMVAGQNAEATAVERQALMKAELEAEIRDEILRRIEMCAQIGRHLPRVIGIVRSDHALITVAVSRIARCRIEV